MNTKNAAEFSKLVLSPLFRMGMMKVLPMGAIADLKIIELDEEHCKVTVPYKYVNKNPFNTTYWAVLGMAAEMASGILLQMFTHKSQPSVSMFVTGCEGKFIKRALGTTTFICNDGKLIADTIQKSIDTLEPQTIKSYIKGFDKDQILIAEFNFEWANLLDS